MSDIGDGLSTIGGWLSDGCNSFKDFAVEAGEFIWGLVTFTVEPSITLPTVFDIGPPARSNSPWGSAFQMWDCGAGGECDSGSDIAVYCVDCGFYSRTYTTGSIRVSPVLGVLGGKVALTGGLPAGLSIGLDANGLYSGEVFRNRVAGFGLSPYQIPGDSPWPGAHA